MCSFFPKTYAKSKSNDRCHIWSGLPLKFQPFQHNVEHKKHFEIFINVFLFEKHIKNDIYVFSKKIV